MNTQLNQVRFTDCKLMGLDFSTCDDFLLTVHFERCPMDMTSFYQGRLSATTFLGCSLKKADFTEAELAGADFSESNLEGALFEDCNLEGADFREAIHLSLDPARNRIKNARFKKEQLAGLLTKYRLQIE
jgi:uncharacterized protein YjbI with pentapeptide repeats